MLLYYSSILEVKTQKCLLPPEAKISQNHIPFMGAGKEIISPFSFSTCRGHLHSLHRVFSKARSMDPHFSFFPVCWAIFIPLLRTFVIILSPPGWSSKSLLQQQKSTTLVSSAAIVSKDSVNVWSLEISTCNGFLWLLLYFQCE